MEAGLGHLNGQLYIDLSDVRTELATDDEFKKKWFNANSKEIFKFFKLRCPDCTVTDVVDQFPHCLNCSEDAGLI